MLTIDQIREKLKNDPFWELDQDASMEEWDLYDKVLEEMEMEDQHKPEEDAKETDTSESVESYDDDDADQWPEEADY